MSKPCYYCHGQMSQSGPRLWTCSLNPEHRMQHGTRQSNKTVRWTAPMGAVNYAPVPEWVRPLLGVPKC